MKESRNILNVPRLAMARALKMTLTLDKAETAEIMAAIDAGKEIIVLNTELSLSSEYALALGNLWSINNPKDTVYFSAPEWGTYAYKNLSPVEKSFRDFTAFYTKPPLLVLTGLSYVPTEVARQQIDVALHRRAMNGTPSIIAGWNMPPKNFKFDSGIELAADTTSEYPMLHGRTDLTDRVMFTKGPDVN